MRGTLVFSLLLLAASCDPESSSPQTQIDRLRVLSVSATPPEIAPGQSTILRPLIAAPGISAIDAPAQTVCVRDRKPSWDRLPDGTCAAGSTEVPVVRTWFTCQPAPATVSNTPCADMETLSNPGDLAQVKGIDVLGFDPHAVLTPPAGLFQGLPPDALPRRKGVLMVALLTVAIDIDQDFANGRPEALARKLSENSIPNVLTVKRVLVLDQPTNTNPPVAGITANGAPIDDGASLGRATLEPQFSAPPVERYVQLDAQGTGGAREEKIVISWFSFFGRFSKERTLFEKPGTEFAPPTGKGIDRHPPGAGPYTMPIITVVRDGRGGEAWAVRQVVIPR